jgi:hypothetical protein
MRAARPESGSLAMRRDLSTPLYLLHRNALGEKSHARFDGHATALTGRASEFAFVFVRCSNQALEGRLPIEPVDLRVFVTNSEGTQSFVADATVKLRGPVTCETENGRHALVGVLLDVSGPNHRPTRYPSSAAKSSDHLSSDAAGILFRDFTDDRRFTIFSRHQLTISLT